MNCHLLCTKTPFDGYIQRAGFQPNVSLCHGGQHTSQISTYITAFLGLEERLSVELETLL